MVKRSRPRKRDAAADHRPKTIGDLRKLLSKIGNPWQPNPRLSDAEPIPEFPTGGDGNMDPVGAALPRSRAIDAIRKEPPSNPHLRNIWIERGLLRPSENLRKKSTSRKSRRPDGGG